MAEESIAGGGLKQECNVLKESNATYRVRKVWKKIVEEILFSRVGYIGKDFKIQRKYDDWIEFKFNWNCSTKTTEVGWQMIGVKGGIKPSIEHESSKPTI